MKKLSAHVRENRRYWDQQASSWVEMGERAWTQSPRWGIWGIPNEDLPMLPADMTGLDAIELGCGTAYGSAWMARLGAVVTGIDNSVEQLGTAERLSREHRVSLDLIHGNAETVPLAAESFDFALSEYGASIWCEPKAWLTEAWRLLRPGGWLVFLGAHPMVHLTAPLDGSLPIGEQLHRPWFGMHELDWTDAVDEPGGIEFCLPTSGWVALFRDIGFQIRDYREPQSPRDEGPASFAVTPAWAHRWPSEQVWWLQKPVDAP